METIFATIELCQTKNMPPISCQQFRSGARAGCADHCHTSKIWVCTCLLDERQLPFIVLSRSLAIKTRSESTNHKIAV